MKVQVLMSDELVKRVDAIANSFGVSRSAYCAMLIGQGVLATERSLDQMDSLALQMTGSLASQMTASGTGANAPCGGAGADAPSSPKHRRPRKTKT